MRLRQETSNGKYKAVNLSRLAGSPKDYYSRSPCALFGGGIITFRVLRESIDDL